MSSLELGLCVTTLCRPVDYNAECKYVQHLLFVFISDASDHSPDVSTSSTAINVSKDNRDDQMDPDDPGRMKQQLVLRENLTERSQWKVEMSFYRLTIIC